MSPDTKPRRTFKAPVRRLRAFATVLLCVAAPLAASGQQAGPVPAYTAEAHYAAPDGTETMGKVVKSGSDMRLEYTEGGRAVVQIIRRAEGVMYVLDPENKSYMVVRGDPDPNAAKPSYMPPCQQGAPGETCEFLGTEVTSGITAEKWRLGLAGQETTVLWDGARKRALRQEFNDGTVMSMAFVAMEDVNGRSVEHWSISLTAPNQQPRSGDWYYDPELRVELREKLPSGEIRSLDNIVVGPVDPAAFAVPDGWTEMAQPTPPAQPPAQ